MPFDVVRKLKIEDSPQEVNCLSARPVIVLTFCLKPAATVIESADLYDFKGIYHPQVYPPASERVWIVMKVVNVIEQVQFKSEKMNKVSLFDTDRFFCDVYCLEPGQVQKVHAHEGSDKIYYLLVGKGKITVGSEEKELAAGEMTLAPSGEAHGVVNHTQEPLVILVFMAPKPQ